MEYTKKYLAVDSTNLAVLRQQADAYYFSNVFDRASEIYEKLINRGDSTFNTMYSLGMSCWNKKELGKARTWLLRAAEKSNFTNAGCVYRLGVVCNEADSLTEGKKYLRMAADMMQPDNRVLAIIYRNLGECFYKDKEYNSAAVAWETAAKYGGGSAILFNIGQVYGLLGNKDKEIEWYKRYINSAELVDNSEDAKKMIEQARKVVGPKWESFNDELIKMMNKKDSTKTNKTTSEKVNKQRLHLFVRNERKRSIPHLLSRWNGAFLIH